jgi:ubiquinone/menaquinone biosynthesis C-methylase UbiE
MKKDTQYKNQVGYFNKEFSGNNKYELQSWQKSYVERVKADMLGKNYKGKSLLDIATGSGYMAVEMAKLGLNVIATDLTPKAVSNLNLYKDMLSLKNIKTKISLAEKLNIPDNSVDYVVANAILEHIPDEKQAAQEWKRVLKNNGKMFITVPLKFRYIFPFLWLPNYLHDKKIGHLRRYDKRSLQNLFKLPIKRIYYSGHIMKIIEILFNLFLRNNRYDDYFEKVDKDSQDKAYGANNISIIFNNEK